MQTSSVIFLVVAVARATPSSNFLSEGYIQKINSQASTWTAGKNFDEDTPLTYIKSLLGTLDSEDTVLPIKEEVYGYMDDIPESFDARNRWPNCSTISSIADQSACGSCWAVATTSVISDRICIHSGGIVKHTPISALDLISCCGVHCGYGCDGGFPDLAWQYWVNTGLVSGGPYKSGLGCKPYPFPRCSHQGPSDAQYKPCPTNTYDTPTCRKECDNKNITYPSDLHKGSSVYNVRKHDVLAIQKEIQNNGPVAASFSVYSDLVSYKSGVYQRTANASVLGAHSVRILGWGVEKGVPYWLIANSWNENWGDNGLFKMLRGNDECGIETRVKGGIPDMSSY